MPEPSVVANATFPALPSPQLLPRTNQLTAGERASSLLTPAQMAAAVSNVAASGTFTVAGTFSTSSILNATIRGVLVAYQVIAGDTTNNGAAASLAAAINANVSLAPLVRATASTNVVTVTALTPGAGGNTFALVASVTGGTMTLTASAAFMAGGSGQLTPQETRGISVEGRFIDLRAGQPILSPPPALLVALQQSGVPCI